MRVFVAGATGYVGSAVVRELLNAGHEVVGLARSDASAAALARTGAGVHRGDLEDLDSLRAGTAKADGVIYAANKHISETTDPAARAKAELSAVEAIGLELAGTGRPFVVTSGVIGRIPGRLLTAKRPPTSPVRSLPRGSRLRAPSSPWVSAACAHPRYGWRRPCTARGTRADPSRS